MCNIRSTAASGMRAVALLCERWRERGRARERDRERGRYTDRERQSELPCSGSNGSNFLWEIPCEVC